MLEIMDYSSRRGVIVPILAKIHAILKENAEKDKTQEPPPHIITWQQDKRKELLDINRRYLVALDGNVLSGFFFYRYDGGKIYIEDIQVAWSHRNNPHVIDGFLKKLEFDPGTKDAAFYASERVKRDADKEMLASKGFKEEHEGGFEKLGTFSQASAAIKIRYSKNV